MTPLFEALFACVVAAPAPRTVPAATRTDATLTLDLAGLSADQRNVATSLVPCMIDLVDDDAHTSGPIGPDDSPTWAVSLSSAEPDLVSRWAELIRFDVGNFGKNRCSLWRTSLEGRTTVVDIAGSTLDVHWDEPASEEP